MCDVANGREDYRRLAASLGALGFDTSAVAQQFAVVNGASTVRQVLAKEYTKSSAPQEKAYLAFVREATGESVAYAVVWTNNTVLFGLHVGPTDLIEKVPASTAEFTPPDDTTQVIGAVQRGEIRIVPLGVAPLEESVRIDPLACSIICNSACSLVVGGVLCAVAILGVCPATLPTGPGAVACAVVMGALCSTVAWSVCFAVCDNMICKPSPGKLRCSCTGTCYDDIASCQNACKPNLGCFTGICQPDPTCL